MSVGERFDGCKRSALDASVEDAIREHCDAHRITPLEAVKLFPVLARRQWLKRFLAHAELFKMTLDVPGDIADLGVFRGLSLLTWANLLEAYCIGDRTKTVWGFDHWAGFAGLTEHDGDASPEAHKVVGGFDSSAFRREVEDAIAVFDGDRFVPQKPRVRLVDGPIEESVDRFVAEHPGVRFSLVHVDCDLYAPTRAALRALWPSVSRGGVVLFDEYGIPDWPGETRAVDEWLATEPGLRLQTLAWTNAPAAFLVKP